jgi:hypothetical protein
MRIANSEWKSRPQPSQRWEWGHLCTDTYPYSLFAIRYSPLAPYTNLLFFIAAPMKEAKRGCGSKGLDFSSGWNCTPMNQG